MAGKGRPTDYKDSFVAKATMLAEFGATDQELADFFTLMPSEEDWLYACLLLIRQDRSGVIAVRKKDKTSARKKRRETDPSFRVREAMRSRMWAALKGKSDGALFSRLGYSIEDICAHLEQLFSDGMTWANYGKWHVDHIKPCSAFNLTNEDDFSRCWALTNLRPLWASDNVKKGAAYVPA